MVSLHVDLLALKDLLALPDRARVVMQQAARDLGAMGHAKAVELAAERLKTRRRAFVDALSVTQLDDHTFFIVLNASARWIDDGKAAGDMLKDLLKSSKAKVSKDGHRYLVVPMRHGPAQDTTPVQQESVDAVRGEMKARGIPWGKIERDDAGRPLYGRLHAFDVKDSPVRSGFGPGQGHGPVGAPRQGMSNRNAAVNQGFGFEAGKPRGGAVQHLAGVSVYQRPGAGGGTQRDILTFRVASEKQLGSGRWNHPGTQPARIFESVHEWMINAWQVEIGPAILKQLAS